jgi:hypothetical protein
MLEAGTMGRVLFLRGLAIIVAVFCVAYIGDALVARFRISYDRQGALSVVTVYYSAALKNNRSVIFGGEPSKMTCIHAIFPHFGYPTCRSVANKIIELD